MINFDKTQVTLDCPGCGHKFKQALGRLKNDPTIQCTACGQPITIDAKGLRDGLKSAEKSAASLARAIKKLGK